VITYAAYLLLAVVAVVTFAPAWLTRAANRGRRAARYTFHELAADTRRWAWELTPGGALEALDRKQDRRHRAPTQAIDLGAVRDAHAACTDRTEAAA